MEIWQHFIHQQLSFFTNSPWWRIKKESCWCLMVEMPWDVLSLMPGFPQMQSFSISVKAKLRFGFLPILSFNSEFHFLSCAFNGCTLTSICSGLAPLWSHRHLAKISEEPCWLLSFQDETSHCKKLQCVVVPERSTGLFSDQSASLDLLWRFLDVVGPQLYSWFWVDPLAFNLVIMESNITLAFKIIFKANFPHDSFFSIIIHKFGLSG